MIGWLMIAWALGAATATGILWLAYWEDVDDEPRPVRMAHPLDGSE